MEINKLKQNNLDANLEISRLIKELSESQSNIAELTGSNKLMTDKVDLYSKEIDKFKDM